MKKQHIKLSETDRRYLKELISKGHQPAKLYKRAVTLLELDRGQTYARVAGIVGVTKQTASTWAKKYREMGLRCLHRLADGEGTSSALIDVLPAAHFGRVDVLFVATNVQRWGQFDPERNTLVAHDNPEPGDEDLLDLAAVKTLMHGGTVYCVKTSKVPGDKPLVAVFRY